MIATRFRTVAWVACVAIAALACYLVSLRVAAERAQVSRLDHALISARQDMRDLSTELNTRSRLVQLERWNADVLALTAPKAGQYLAGEMQLASLATASPSAAAAQVAGADAPAVAALEAPAEVARIAYHPIAEKPATRLVHHVSLDLDDAGPSALQRVALYDAGGKPARP